MKLTAEQVARIIIETSELTLPVTGDPKSSVNPVNEKNCRRIVKLVKDLDPLNSILNDELYTLCESIYEFYATEEEITTQDIASLITQLTNKIVYS